MSPALYSGSAVFTGLLLALIGGKYGYTPLIMAWVACVVAFWAGSVSK